MQVCRHAGHAPWKNLATLSYELFQQIGIFIINRFDRDVDTAARHRAIGTAKSGAAFGSFRLHLFSFAMERVFAQERIVFLFFEPVRGARTFFVSPGHVTRDRFAERLRFGALESDNFLRHKFILWYFRSLPAVLLRLRSRRPHPRLNRRER